MPEQGTPIQGGPVQGATDDDAKFKSWLKEKYEIEDDPESFKTKRASWKKAEEENPQYKATLDALIEHVRNSQTQVQDQPIQQAPRQDDEEEIRRLSRVDPYEGAKRVAARMERSIEERMQQYSQASVQQAEASVYRREGLKRAYDIVKQQWPEAFETESELHKMGKQVFQQEMSPVEQAHPQAFLIATERAAGRLGLAPKMRRSSASRRSDVSAQSVSRSGSKGPSDNDDTPLTPRQRQVAAGIGVDEKAYKQALKIRKDQKKREDDD